MRKLNVMTSTTPAPVRRRRARLPTAATGLLLALAAVALLAAAPARAARAPPPPPKAAAASAKNATATATNATNVLGLAYSAKNATAPTTTNATNVLGLAYSGSGFLSGFHAGVQDQLREIGLVSRTTPVAGSSGGALTGASSCLGAPETNAFIVDGLLDYCRPRRSCQDELDRVVRTATGLAIDLAYNASLAAAAAAKKGAPAPTKPQKQYAGPEISLLLIDLLTRNESTAAASGKKNITAAEQAERDAFVRARCSGGVLYATVSRLDPAVLAALAAPASPPDPIPLPPSVVVDADPGGGLAIVSKLGNATEAWRVSDYRSESDFVDALAASSFLPFFSAPRAFTPFRGAASIDGAFSQYLPPCAPGVTECVRVTVAVPGVPGIPGMSPPVADADIGPDPAALPANLTSEQWMALGLVVPSQEVAAAIYQHGREQALAWAQRRAAAAAKAPAPAPANKRPAAPKNKQQQQQQQQPEQQPQPPQRRQRRPRQQEQPSGGGLRRRFLELFS